MVTRERLIAALNKGAVLYAERYAAYTGFRSPPGPLALWRGKPFTSLSDDELKTAVRQLVRMLRAQKNDIARIAQLRRGYHG